MKVGRGARLIIWSSEILTIKQKKTQTNNQTNKKPNKKNTRYIPKIMKFLIQGGGLCVGGGIA